MFDKTVIGRLHNISLFLAFLLADIHLCSLPVSIVAKYKNPLQTLLNLSFEIHLSAQKTSF